MKTLFKMQLCHHTGVNTARAQPTSVSTKVILNVPLVVKLIYYYLFGLINGVINQSMFNRLEE